MTLTAEPVSEAGWLAPWVHGGVSGLVSAERFVFSSTLWTGIVADFVPDDVTTATLGTALGIAVDPSPVDAFCARFGLEPLPPIIQEQVSVCSPGTSIVAFALEHDPDFGGDYLAVKVGLAVTREDFREVRGRILDGIAHVVGTLDLSRVVLAIRRISRRGATGSP